MKNVLGAIDGTHIQISGQSFCNESYINRKGFTSVIIQAVCDYQYAFADCYCGWPVSVHDSRVFQNSDILSRIEEDEMDMFPEGTFLIRDRAYQIRTWMLTPYKDRTTLKDYQAKYNYIQSATRNTIERAFPMLKGRFNRLKHINNFCIAEKESVDFNIELEEEMFRSLPNILRRVGRCESNVFFRRVGRFGMVRSSESYAPLM